MHPKNVVDIFYRHIEQDPDNPIDGCWIWKAAKFHHGYGMLQAWVGGRKLNLYAHRVGYEIEVGPIPEGTEIDHLCRRRDCCNPLHLEPVSHEENVRRSRATKLTREMVDEIRVMLASRTLTYREIGDLYGVTKHCIAQISLGRNWKS